MTSRFAFLRPLGHVGKLLPVLALIGCLYLLLDRLDDFEMQDIGAAMGQLSVWQWLGAMVMTGVSFAAIGQYDAVVHRVLGTGVRPARAKAAGMLAIALSQTVGFSSLSGGLVRLRCLPELDLWTVTRLTVLVSLSFLGSWAVLAGSVTLLSHGGPVSLIAGLITGLLVVIIWRVTQLQPDSDLPGLSPRIGADLLLWTTVDTTCATLVLGLLLPPHLMPAFSTLFAAYLLALGAGLLSQSPAGLGAFELTLLLLLPQVPEGPLLAAVLAYRVIYFLIPALIALAFLVRPAALPAQPTLQTAVGAARSRALAQAPHADWGLMHQGAEIVLNADQSTGWLLRPAGRCLVTIGMPLGCADLSGLQGLARQRGLAPVLYKCDNRTASQARKQGWAVIRIAQDAVLRLDDWSLDQPGCRQLRRKLRHVQAAGLQTHLTRTLPLPEMAHVAALWSVRNAAEKGFSMGQFDPALLWHQRVILGYLGDKLIGFASFHQGPTDWALDLMRYSPDAPAGTMHALVCAGIAAAKDSGAAQVSLAAVPVWPDRWACICASWPGVKGLRQFKGSFGPAWKSLYLCAPTQTGLIFAAVTIAAAIHMPPTLTTIRTDRSRFGQSIKPAFGDVENFQIENPGQACDAQDQTFRRASAVTPAALRPGTGHSDDVQSHDQRPFPPA